MKVRAAAATLARTHLLTVFDAGYLALAIREDCALASLDRRLNDAAAEGVIACKGDRARAASACLAVLEADHHARAAGRANAPLARPV